jgi:mannose-6-phosphate isomerase-like protein (cupin superfamily)
MPITVRNAADVMPAVRPSIHGGDGSFEMRFVYGDQELVSALRVFELCRLPPDTSIGEHVHDETEEIYFILSGVGVMSLDGMDREVHAGDVVLTQPIARHGIRNPGPSDLELLIVEVGVSSDPRNPHGVPDGTAPRRQ